MTIKQLLDDWLEIRQTIERLHEANIITAEVGDARPARIQLHIAGDPTETIRDIGTGLIDVDNDTYDDWTRYTMTDINGVIVEWLKRKAPDVAPSEAEKEGDTDGTGNSIAPSTEHVNDNRDRLLNDLDICFMKSNYGCDGCSHFDPASNDLECREGLIADVIDALREDSHESQN